MGKVGELYVGGDNHIRLPSWYSSRGKPWMTVPEP